MSFIEEEIVVFVFKLSFLDSWNNLSNDDYDDYENLLVSFWRIF